MPKKPIIIVALFALALLLSACGGGSATTSQTADGGDRYSTALEAADPTEFGAVANKLSVRGIERFPAVINVSLDTPEGGFEGASDQDLAGEAGAAFKAIHHTGWKRAITVTFKGGMVDSTTGKDLPDAKTGLFRLHSSDARRIDWQNADEVDWTNYALFLHPALKR